MERLKVAIVGCGIISGAHIGAFARYPERAEIVALCDRDETRAQKAAADWSEKLTATPQIVTDYDAILADPNIAAVDLCLPHNLHAEMAIAAARAGKQILCEKPLALTPEDCDRMADAANQAGVVLMHGENMRTSETAERAAEVVREGRLGTVVGMQAAYAHWQNDALNKDWRTVPSESGGGHLIDGAIHWIDVIRHVCGDIAAVHAMTARFRPELGATVEDTGVLNFRFTGGHLGQLFACHASRGRGASPTLTVFGTEGCLTIDAFGGDRGLMLFPHNQTPEVLVTTHSWNDTFYREIGHFLDVVQHGVPLRATPADARENLRVVLAAYESARSGREVTL